MRETFDMMAFVHGAYVVTIVSVVVLLGWSWLAMRKAEKRRDEARGDRSEK